MNKLGADILRLWWHQPTTLAKWPFDEILKRAADSYRRIRNTARFLLANPERF